LGSGCALDQPAVVVRGLTLYSVARLHSASNANVVRPLAFEAGVLPDSASGTGVAQIHGVVCEPNSTGPPIGWFVITRRASRAPWLSPATKSLRPSTRALTSPRSVRAA